MKKVAAGIAALVLIVGVADAQSRKSGSDKPKRLGMTERAKIKKLIQSYFEELDPGKRGEILKELEPLDYPSKSNMGAFAKDCFKLMRLGPRHDGKPTATCSHPKHPGTYLIQVPSQAKKGAKTGIFISLHGGGPGVGDPRQIQSLFGTPAPNLINIFPKVIQTDNDAWNLEREEQYVLAIVDELKRTYNIDGNRIYIAGHSMGGFGAWSIGGRHADLFAAASSMAGAAYQPGVVPNFRNLPMYFDHSKDDQPVPVKYDIEADQKMKELAEKYGGYEHVFDLHENNGHAPPPKGVKPIFDWMLKRVRDPYPKKIVWESSRKYKKFFYWLKKGNEKDCFIVAERDGNTFTVTGAPPGTWIYLNDDMCKLSKPVIVKDGDKEVFNDVVPYSVVALVDSIGAKMDPDCFFVARVKVK